MFISSHVFLATVVLLNSFKKSESSCKNAYGQVTCESVSYISNAVIGRIPDISLANRITITANTDLEISPKAFESAAKVRSLIINDNKISKLYYDSFQNSPMKYLSLQSNGIDSFPPGTFSTLSDLEILRLENNNLQEVPMGLGNMRLKELKLSNNKIKTIEKELENLPNLSQLFLDNNKLESIYPHRILTNPERLGLLYIQNNFLTLVTSHMLQRLSNLLFLNVGGNLISFIEPNAFEQTPHLNSLVLSSNHLKEIHENVLPSGGMPYLKTLYLDNNKLMYLSASFFVRLEALKQVSIVGNPWFCSCLTALEKLVAEGNLEEICTDDYTNGKRPICVNNGTSVNKCRHIYNSDLSDKYQTYKNNHPPVKPPLSCVRM